jgi:hypothetical protein
MEIKNIKENCRQQIVNELIKNKNYSNAIGYCHYYKSCPICEEKLENFKESKPKARNHLYACYKKNFIDLSDTEKIEKERIEALGSLLQGKTEPAFQFIFFYEFCPLNCGRALDNDLTDIKHLVHCLKDAIGDESCRQALCRMYDDYVTANDNNASSFLNEIRCSVCHKPFNTQTKANSHFQAEHMILNK